MGYENIPECLRGQDKWVCARSTRKMPLRADMLLMASFTPLGFVSYEDICASVDNPETWGSFEAAYNNIEQRLCSHIGYVFDGDGYIGIDLDHCFVDDMISDRSIEIVKRFGSYAEISKSGEGIHIICKGKLPFTGSNNRNGIEIYSTRRFFILTGNTVGYKDVVENQEAIDWLLETYFGDIRKEKTEDVAKVYKPSLYQTNIRLVDNRLHINTPIIKQGVRNCTLLSYGGVLLCKGYSREKVIEKIREMNEKKCSPPLSNEEVDNIIKSVMKYNREVL